MPNPYIATKPIFVGTALAHNVGDEVPDENVKANGWQDSVARSESKAAKDATPPEGLSQAVTTAGSLTTPVFARFKEQGV